MRSALPVDAPAQAERKTAQAPRIAASRMMMVPFRGSNLPGSKVCHIQGNLSVRRSRLREAGSGQGGKAGHSVPAAGSGGAAASGRRRAIRLPGDHFGSAPVSPRRHRVRPRIWQVTNPRAPACPRAGATSAPARHARTDYPPLVEHDLPRPPRSRAPADEPARGSASLLPVRSAPGDGSPAPRRSTHVWLGT